MRHFTRCTAFTGLCASVVLAASDVQWTFNNVGFTAYEMVGFSDSAAPLNTSTGATNPTLTLRLGMRYGVTVVNFTVHPLQLIAKAASDVGDTVLLAMGATVGPFETNTGVNWADNGNGTVEFTLMPDLVAAMGSASQVPGYRCGVHTSTIRGDFVIVPEPAALTVALVAAAFIGRTRLRTRRNRFVN